MFQYTTKLNLRLLNLFEALFYKLKYWKKINKIKNIQQLFLESYTYKYVKAWNFRLNRISNN